MIIGIHTNISIKNVFFNISVSCLDKIYQVDISTAILFENKCLLF